MDLSLLQIVISAGTGLLGAGIPVLIKFFHDWSDNKRKADIEQLNVVFEQSRNLTRDLVAGLQNQIFDMRRQIADLQKDNVSCTRENAELKARITLLVNENAELTIRIRTLEFELAQMKRASKETHNAQSTTVHDATE